MSITMTSKDGRFQCGHRLWAGKWHAFDVDWACMSKDYDGPHWRLTCRLPGIKDDLGLFASPELALEKARRVLARWVAGLGEVRDE